MKECVFIPFCNNSNTPIRIIFYITNKPECVGLLFSLSSKPNALDFAMDCECQMVHVAIIT